MIKIFVTGDFVAKEPDDIKVSSELKNMIKTCDLSICNFEAPVKNSSKAAIKSGPSLFQSEKSPAFLEKLGFNVILMANNHIMDYGEQGYLKTVNLFNASTLVGAGKGSEAYQVKIIEVKGIKIGLLSVCQYEFGIVDINSNDIGVAWVNTPEMPDIIASAKKTVDYLIVLPHAGLENYDQPLPEWRKIYQKFIDWGANVVIAGHTHCPQGYEIYKDSPIFYSLGNFYFDAINGGPLWSKGLGVILAIQESMSFNLIHTSFEKGLLKLDDSNSIMSHYKQLQETLLDESKYNKYINEACSKEFPLCQYGIMRGMAGISRNMKIRLWIKLIIHALLNHRDTATFLNTVRCESHRWVIERYLNNVLKN